jgi:hypothetical protein
MQSRQGHSWGCIAPNGFQHDISLQSTHLPQLLGHQKTVVLVANDQGLCHRQTLQTRDSRLQH